MPKEKDIQNNGIFLFFLCLLCKNDKVDYICVLLLLHLLGVVAEQYEEQVNSDETETEFH